MSVDIFDKAVMVIAIIVVVTFTVFYTERPMLIDTGVSINGSYNESDNDFLENIFNSTTTTSRSFSRSTTTTTIVLMVTSDVGSPVAAVKTLSGSVIVNCGSTTGFIDKLYMSDYLPIRYAYITSMDENNMGGCSGGFLIHMPSNIYDSGVNVKSVAMDNYVFAVGNKRRNANINDSFRLFRLNGTVVDSYNGEFSIYMDIGSSSMLYLSGCDNCSLLIDTYKPYLLVVDDNTEFSIIGYKPHIIVGKFNGEVIDGLDVFDLSSGVDFNAIVDGDGMHI